MMKMITDWYVSFKRHIGSYRVAIYVYVYCVFIVQIVYIIVRDESIPM